MLGALMFVSTLVLQALPNIHLVGMLTMAYTLSFRRKALYPVYLFVLLDGLYFGFNVYWIPYLYVWAVLWGVTMLLPRRMPVWLKYVVYPVVCGLHGLLFGTLYAPVWALLNGLSFKATLAWIGYGLPYDAIHGAGNFALGFLIVPFSDLINRLMKALNRGRKQKEPKPQ